MRCETKWGERIRIVRVSVNVCSVLFTFPLFVCLFVCLFVQKGCSGWLQWGGILRYGTKWGERIRIVRVSVNVCSVYLIFPCLFVCSFV